MENARGDLESPLCFLYMELTDRIKDIAESHLKDEAHFIVDVISKGITGKTKFLILLDGDKGINIDDCAELSRKVAADIELEDLVEYAYILEVSSPGLDHPIKLKRQYIKNIGRNLSVRLQNGEELKGELLSINDNTLEILKEKKVQKKKEVEPVTILLNEIEKAKVLVSFK